MAILQNRFFDQNADQQSSHMGQSWSDALQRKLCSRPEQAKDRAADESECQIPPQWLSFRVFSWFILECRVRESILIVDDDAALVELLGIFLTSRGYEILLADDADVAIG